MTTATVNRISGNGQSADLVDLAAQQEAAAQRKAQQLALAQNVYRICGENAVGVKLGWCAGTTVTDKGKSKLVFVDVTILKPTSGEPAELLAQLYKLGPKMVKVSAPSVIITDGQGNTYRLQWDGERKAQDVAVLFGYVPPASAA